MVNDTNSIIVADRQVGAFRCELGVILSPRDLKCVVAIPTITPSTLPFSSAMYLLVAIGVEVPSCLIKLLNIIVEC